MQNYVFKGAQWLDGTAAEGDKSNAFLGYLSPEILANAAMESFDQATSNCYACHMDAGSSFTPVDDDHPGRRTRFSISSSRSSTFPE